jgi:hypothetical protein
MALIRECEMVLSSDLTHECAGSRLSPPENLVSTVPCAERCNRTWNNRSLIGQGSNSATCRICRVSRRRSGHVISRAVSRAARKPFWLVFWNNHYQNPQTLIDNGAIPETLSPDFPLSHLFVHVVTNKINCETNWSLTCAVQALRKGVQFDEIWVSQAHSMLDVNKGNKKHK